MARSRLFCEGRGPGAGLMRAEGGSTSPRGPSEDLLRPRAGGLQQLRVELVAWPPAAGLQGLRLLGPLCSAEGALRAGPLDALAQVAPTRRETAGRQPQAYVGSELQDCCAGSLQGNAAGARAMDGQASSACCWCSPIALAAGRARAAVRSLGAPADPMTACPLPYCTAPACSLIMRAHSQGPACGMRSCSPIMPTVCSPCAVPVL